MAGFLKNLTAGTFFSNDLNRTTLEGTYKALKNLKPAMGVLVSNLMYLEKTPCPTGLSKNDPEMCAKFANDFCDTILNHPQSKAALAAVLKKMLLDSARQKVASRAVLSGKYILDHKTWKIHSRIKIIIMLL